mmetsp:Transcript_45567/g.55304  ORF Transcript_45567/g.55304 Transcript_45567/m.55304 type:complete len:122 (-) Transcript_45567:23-388(-)
MIRMCHSNLLPAADQDEDVQINATLRAASTKSCPTNNSALACPILEPKRYLFAKIQSPSWPSSSRSTDNSKTNYHVVLSDSLSPAKTCEKKIDASTINTATDTPNSRNTFTIKKATDTTER